MRLLHAQFLKAFVAPSHGEESVTRNAQMATMLRFCVDESGATAVEYGMIVALVFLAMISGVAALGQSLEDLYNYAGRALIQAMSGAVQSGTGQP